MNILLISVDRMLADCVARTVIREGDTFQLCTDIEAAAGYYKSRTIEVVIMSDHVAEAADWPFVQVGEPGDNRAQHIYLLSNRHLAASHADALKQVLSEGWETVRPGLTVKQVAERIGQMIYGHSDADVREQGRSGIIHFVGTTPNIGVTVAAFGTAVQMARLTERRVAYICLNLKSSKLHRYVGEKEPIASLDSLRAELRSGSLTAERLLRQAAVDPTQPNLYWLYGNMQREQADYYGLEEIECLLRLANESFDYCLVETSAYWDNAATVGTLQHAGHRIMVTTPQLGCFQEDMNRWFSTLAPIFDMRPAQFDLLITQVDSNSSYSAKQIVKETEMVKLGEIRRLPDLDRVLSDGRIREAVAEGTTLSTDLHRLARSLLTLCGEPYRSKSTAIQRQSFWSGWLLRTRRTAEGRISVARK